MTSRPHSPCRTAVFKLASRVIGVSTSEVDGFTVRQVERVIQRLLESSLLHRGKVSSKVVRFFADKQDSEAFVDAALLAARPKPKVVLDDAYVAPWPADAPIHYPRDKRGRPLWRETAGAPSRIGLNRTNTHHDDY